MQPDTHIQNLLKKYIHNQCSKDEVDEVVAYFQGIKEVSQLPSVEDVLAILDKAPILEDIDANRIHNNIIETVKKEEKVSPERKSYFWKYAVAASVLLIVSLTIFFNKGKETIERVQPVIVNTNTIDPGTDKATLTLANGEQVPLEKGTSFQTLNANSDGEKIVYDTDNRKTKDIAYNYLTIPRGGQFYIVLSDGTKVWLNSESQLKYPVNFIEGETRQVELVYGEAYFNVTSSIENQGSKFVVFNNSQEVEVLGTEFNIKAYADESNITTTLAEGKVSVKSSLSTQVINPGEQTLLDLDKNTITISKVNVYNEVSWKDGVFSFEQKPLGEIMKVLSRWYDIQVVFENKDLKGITFTGVLGKNQKVKDILLTLKTLSTIKDYEINDKTITLK